MFHAACVLHNYMYVFGGRDLGGADLNDLHRYNLKSHVWEKLHPTGPSAFLLFDYSLFLVSYFF